MTTIRFYQFLEGFDISGAVYNFISKVEDIAASVKQTVAMWIKRSKQRQQFDQLSDRTLQDIGLTRYDVEVESGKFFWQK